MNNFSHLHVMGVLHTRIGLVAPSSVSPESKDGEVFVEGDPREYVLLKGELGRGECDDRMLRAERLCSIMEGVRYLGGESRTSEESHDLFRLVLCHNH